MRAASVAALIPAASARCGILRRAVACDGTWVGPSIRSRGSGRRPEGEPEWLEIREARWQPFPAKRQQWRGAGDRPSGSRCDGALRQRSAREAKVVPRDRNRRRGCRKAAHGTREVPGSPARGSQGGLARSPGAGAIGPRVADEAPAYPSHPRPAAGDGRRVGTSAVRTRRSSTCNAGCAVNPPSARCGTRSPGAARAGAGTGPARRRGRGCGSPCGIRTACPRRSAASADWRWKSRGCR